MVACWRGGWTVAYLTGPPQPEAMIDLRSDTVTRPNEAMREAAATAEVGDDVYGEDPTVNDLQDRAADLVGMEAALYVPTGTMGNQVAARTHTERGQEIVLDTQSHIYNAELGGLAQHSDLQTRPVDAGERAVPTPEQFERVYLPGDDHRAPTGLLAIENTHNMRGGVAVPPEHVEAVAEAAHAVDVPVHLDGARVCNAAVALDVPVETLTDPVDSVMFCLSKGLGAPVGSLLCGTEEFIDRAHRNRKLLGGGMRQAGVIAAPGIEALANVERLAEDHANAAALAEGLAAVDGLDVATPDTNILLVNTQGIDMPTAAFLEACEETGVLGSNFGPYTTRFVTHWDVDADDITEAVDRIRTAISG